MPLTVCLLPLPAPCGMTKIPEYSRRVLWPVRLCLLELLLFHFHEIINHNRPSVCCIDAEQSKAKQSSADKANNNHPQRGTFILFWEWYVSTVQYYIRVENHGK